MRKGKTKRFDFTEKPVSKAVLYLRFSSYGQREESIEGQRKACVDYCKAHKIEVVAEYIDRAKSATTDDRPEFQRMISDSSSGVFDAILVYKTDRFARDRYDSAIYRKELKDNGVQLLSVTDPFIGVPDQVVVDSVFDGMNEYFSAELSQKVKRGNRTNVMKGKPIGGAKKPGYKVVGDHYEIDPVDAPTIKEIFRLYVYCNMTINEITKHLRTHGMLRPDGKPYCHSSIEQILASDRYIGYLRCDGAENPKAFPRLIDDETFERAQARRKERAHCGGANAEGNEYLLSGKIVCAECGSPVIGAGGYSHTGKLYSYYQCSKSKGKKGCDAPCFRKKSLEKLVVKQVFSELSSPEIARPLALQLLHSQSKPSPEIISLEERLKSVKAESANFMKAIGMGIITEQTKDRLLELEDEQRELEKKLRDEKMSVKSFSKREIETAIEILGESDLDDMKGVKEAIASFVTKIVLHKNGAVDVYISLMGAPIVKSIPAEALTAVKPQNGTVDFGGHIDGLYAHHDGFIIETNVPRTAKVQFQVKDGAQEGPENEPKKAKADIEMD